MSTMKTQISQTRSSLGLLLLLLVVVVMTVTTTQDEAKHILSPHHTTYMDATLSPPMAKPARFNVKC
jgi:hypothetical protein